tara:strand:- start:173 stop:1342 length:1170 start_codon:yes stop_codon:yes gene_type:complete
MSKKGCSYYNTSDGKPHCKKNKTGIMDPRCHVPKKNCRVNRKSPFLTEEDLSELSEMPQSPVVASAASSDVRTDDSGLSAEQVEVVQPEPPVQPQIVEYQWHCGYCKALNNAESATCIMCGGRKDNKLFDGYSEPWVCLRCFQTNDASAPGIGCVKCGESKIILDNGSNLRRRVRDCDNQYCNEIQINSWCFKHAMNNLIQRHKYFVGEFDGPVEDGGQINVMGICKLETAEKLPEYYGMNNADDVTLDNANNLLQLCGPSVNVSTVTAYRAIEAGGYTSTEIYNEFGEKDSKINQITPDFLANPQLLGFLLRISLQAGDANTNHFTALRKESDCPNMFKYIESRPSEPHKPGPWTECLNLDLGTGVVRSFLSQHKDRIKSIIAVYTRQ